MEHAQEYLELILDIGAAMIRSGAETHRVEDSLYRLAEAYTFRDSQIWVVPTNIQASLRTPEGDYITQIRHIRGAGIDLDRLEQLNALSRRACAEKPESGELKASLEAILRTAPQPLWLTLLAGVLGGACFGVFFNCDLMDTLVAAVASLLITFFLQRLGRRESNPLILNFLISCVTEAFILLSVRLGIGHHGGYITVGVVMLLISALGAANGLRDLVHLDTLSGVMNITVSLTGAIGIALGIALPLFLLKDWGGGEITALNPNVFLQLAAATFGCAGFALWFRVRGRKVLFCALGGLLTWGTYLICVRLTGSFFAATFTGAALCGLYAQVMARILRAPATVFSTVCVLPLIPGAALYYTMAGLVMKNADLAAEKGLDLFLACFGIVLGFMAVEVVSRLVWRAVGSGGKK